MSDKFKSYLKKRNKSVEGLEVISLSQLPTIDINIWLEQEKFSLVNSEYYSANNEENEFHEYIKDGWKIVILQTYIEKEGGMNYETIYSSKPF